MWKTLAVTAALAAASVAQAAPRTTAPQNNHFSWSYADVGIATHDLDGLDSNLTSLDGDISYAVNEHLYGLGGASLGKVHDLKVYNLHGGLGFHTPLAKDLDVFGEGELEWSRYDAHHTDNESGYTLRAGVRNRTTDKLELKAGLYHTDVVDTDTGLFGSALYHLTDKVDAGVRLGLGDDETRFGLFGRFNF